MLKQYPPSNAVVVVVVVQLLKTKKKLTVFLQIKPTCYLRSRPGGWITETNKYSPLIQARKWNNPLCLKMFCNKAAKKLNNCRKCYVSVSSGSVSGRIQVCNMKVTVKLQCYAYSAIVSFFSSIIFTVHVLMLCIIKHRVKLAEHECIW